MRGLLVAFLLAGCATPPELPAVPRYDTAALAAMRFQSVIVAGDASINAFENAAERLTTDLVRRGGATPADLQRYSARSPSRRPPGAGLATVADFLDGVARMRPGPNGACLVFATAHGVPRDGLQFPANPSDQQLDAVRLDRALVLGCGNAPTVVILSGCFSGGYIRPPMTRANRIILTAARADRPSFGCGAGNVFTEFDDCLLTALEAATGVWQNAFAEARVCVAARERRQNQMPSEPQAWFGPAISTLRLPWPKSSP